MVMIYNVVKICNGTEEHHQGGYKPINNGQLEEDPRLLMFDSSLPYFGCGLGWLFFLLGFILPFMWYYATILYCCKYHNRDPRECSGLAASTIMALLFTIGSTITLIVLLV